MREVGRVGGGNAGVKGAGILWEVAKSRWEKRVLCWAIYYRLLAVQKGRALATCDRAVFLALGQGGRV